MKLSTKSHRMSSSDGGRCPLNARTSHLNTIRILEKMQGNFPLQIYSQIQI